MILVVLAVLGLLGVAGCGGSVRTTTEDSPVTSTVRHDPGGRHRGTATDPSKLVTNARPQPSWRRYTGPVPILVYHDLGTAPASEPYPGLFMPYATFRTEMAWLHSAGYEAVTLDEVMDAWFHGGTLPAKPIVITFDNGYPPQVTFAPSVLSRYGWPGVLNEITAGHLHDAQIESVLRIGWEVDSHSVSHPDLRDLTPEELRYQLVASREFLQRTFHIPVNSFCYPSSKYDDAVVAAVRAAGYTNAVTEGGTYATSEDPYLLPRFEMTTDLPQLQADLADHTTGP